MKKGKMMIVSVLIVLAVVIVLVYITINKKESSTFENKEVEVGENTNMQNAIDGVKIAVLKEGTGEVVKAGDTVAMNYTGTFENGTAFDSNIDPKFGHVEPFVFTIGAGQVIKGWDLGIAGMKVGEKRTLVLKPEFAYGAGGAGNGAIPPNSTLVFEVELLGIKK
jgi:peptidylprolyl isomerase